MAVNEYNRRRSVFGYTPAGAVGTGSMSLLCLYEAYKKVLKIAIEIVGDLGLMEGVFKFQHLFCLMNDKTRRPGVAGRMLLCE